MAKSLATGYRRADRSSAKALHGLFHRRSRHLLRSSLVSARSATCGRCSLPRGLAESDPTHARLSNGSALPLGFYKLAKYNEKKRAHEHSRTRLIVGWICYLAAISQYLIIGLVTSRDRAMKVLTLFDQAVAERRKELIETYNLQDPAEPPERDIPSTD
ncbi:MAG UNVERIFIED_CONTAM: hypothetical protein LVR18_06400 [Planctomycetaceae bacterium]